MSFAYVRATDLSTATARASEPGAVVIAGGTDVLQLVREHVSMPARVVDITPALDASITDAAHGVRIGAGARLSAVAEHPLIAARYACVAEALRETASRQVRNLATIGGNLLQRTRCLYFRDVATPCNKRVPGAGCGAMEGQNRINAILGGSTTCIAVHPSDLAVALLACDASVVVHGVGGERTIPLAELHRLPGDTPEIETVLHQGDIVAAIELPSGAARRRSVYVKVRDRASFEWAIASCAVAMRMEHGRVAEIRVAVGGVATKPWRLPQVEATLHGQALHPDIIAAAALRAAEGAVAHGHNAYKVPLLVGTVRKALREASTW